MALLALFWAENSSEGQSGLGPGNGLLGEWSGKGSLGQGQGLLLVTP